MDAKPPLANEQSCQGSLKHISLHGSLIISLHCDRITNISYHLAPLRCADMPEWLF